MTAVLTLILVNCVLVLANAAILVFQIRQLSERLRDRH